MFRLKLNTTTVNKINRRTISYVVMNRRMSLGETFPDYFVWKGVSPKMFFSSYNIGTTKDMPSHNKIKFGSSENRKTGPRCVTLNCIRYMKHKASIRYCFPLIDRLTHIFFYNFRHLVPSTRRLDSSDFANPSS